VIQVKKWRLTSLSHWSKVKVKSPCNFLKSPPMSPTYFYHVSFMKLSISWVFFKKSIVSISILKVVFFKVIHFSLKKLSFWSITNKNGDIGKVMQSGTVQWEMLNCFQFNYIYSDPF
jgi:hypothetical protein